MLDHLIAWTRKLRRELQDRRELRQLLDQDDRMLQDIGLTRTDVQSALMKPLGTHARHEAFRLARLSLVLDRVM